MQHDKQDEIAVAAKAYELLLAFLQQQRKGPNGAPEPEPQAAQQRVIVMRQSA